MDETPAESPLGETVVQRLDEQLDRSRVKERSGGGRRKLSYIEGHDAIRTANRIFGYGNWGHEIVELAEIAAVEVESTGDQPKPGWSVGYRCTVRLTVRGCVPVSGVGYGDGIEYSGAVARHRAAELAVKESETDALKRALVKFGDQFGLVLYEKDAPAQRQEQEEERGRTVTVEYAEEAEVQVFLSRVRAASFDVEAAEKPLREENGRVRRSALDRAQKALERAVGAA